MIGQQLKDLYYSAARWATLPNYARGRLRYRRGAGAGWSVHLGCGTNYRPGYVNIDGNVTRRSDLWLDLRNGLPFPDRSVALIYCSHVLEHLYPEEALTLLREMRRTLRADGVARVAVPSFRHAMEVAQGLKQASFPRAFDSPEAQAINFLFCDGQHKYAYSFSVMESFAKTAGFFHVYDYSADHGIAPKRYHGVEAGGEPPGSLVVELRP